jgi:hypothetical protein
MNDVVGDLRIEKLSAELVADSEVFELGVDQALVEHDLGGGQPLQHLPHLVGPLTHALLEGSRVDAFGDVVGLLHNRYEVIVVGIAGDEERQGLVLCFLCWDL